MEKINFGSPEGIIRKVDDLGRIVVPMEWRKRLGIITGTPMEIQFDGENILMKVSEVKETEKIISPDSSQRKNLGDVSDGYHTFNELYHHRAALFSQICNEHKDVSWKSKLHSDGTMFDGMFIAGIDTPAGQATYHYNMEEWDLFQTKELDKSPQWDGHTPNEALERIKSLG